MKRKIISWLAFMAVFLFLLHSCVHDEIYSSSDPASREYHSKSVFKEDEKYIKNVMDIYFENEEAIKKTAGTPLWDYAMTMGTMDESFLIVPVADGKTVITCLQVPRNGNYVRFLYDNDREHIKFFQNYLLSEKREPVKQEPYSNPAGKGLAECKVTAVSMWYPADEYGSNAGYWETNYIITCPPEQTDGDGNESGPGDTTYPYPGGGGNPNPQNPKTPCEKTKNILNNPELQSAITKMKNQAALPVSAQNYGEIGYKFKADGTSSGMISGGKHEVELGPEAGYQGGYHNHPLMGIKMLSPDDIVKLLNFAMAQPNGNIADAFMGMIGAGVDGTEYHYVIQYTGNMQELQQYLYSNNWDLDKLKETYVDRKNELLENSLYINFSTGKLNNQGLEKLFFGTLKNMGLENKVNLQRIENNVIKNVTLDSNGSTTTANSCP